MNQKLVKFGIIIFPLIIYSITWVVAGQFSEPLHSRPMTELERSFKNVERLISPILIVLSIGISVMLWRKYINKK